MLRRKLLAAAAAVAAIGALGISGPASAATVQSTGSTQQVQSLDSSLQRLPVPAHFKTAKLPVGKNEPKRKPGALAPVSPRTTTSLSANAALTGPYYFYAIGAQTAANAGAGATFEMVNPGQVISGTHSVTEIALCKETTVNNCVEIGIDKDPGLYGDSNMHVFVYSWVGGAGRGYNGSNPDWVDVSTNSFNAGSTVATADLGTFQNLQWQHETSPVSAWWGYYKGNAIGYFPDTAWSGISGGFTVANYNQLYGEVESTTNAAPCTDMGNGILPGTTGAARMGSWTYFGSTVTPSLSLNATNPSQYNITYITTTSTRSVYYGGPGFC